MYITDKFVQKIINETKEKRVYIYGAGTYGRILGKFLEIKNLYWDGYIDKNASDNQYILEKKIYSLSSLKDLGNSYILISLSPFLYRHEIKSIINELSAIGVNRKNIVWCGENVELFNEIIYITENPKICLEKNKKLKNVFAGERCFIIGNGPSLTVNDLEKVKNEITMGCNGIIDLAKICDWKPTCFFFEDSIFVRDRIKNREQLEILLGYCKYAFTTLKNNLYEKYDMQYEKLYYLYPYRILGNMFFSNDISEKIYSAGTTLYTMMQVAVYMGIKEIYLLGVDFSFHREVDSNGKIIVNKDVKNHMEMMEQVNEGLYDKNIILKGYECALNYMNEHGIGIYNATRGGKLETYERRNFDSLF